MSQDRSAAIMRHEKLRDARPEWWGHFGTYVGPDLFARESLADTWEIAVALGVNLSTFGGLRFDPDGSVDGMIEATNLHPDYICTADEGECAAFVLACTIERALGLEP